MSAARQTRATPQTDTRDHAEIAHFDGLSARWWDGNGPMAVLHRFNPVRVSYVREQAVTHFGLDARSAQPLKGLSVVDIGCGGGILSEPMARMGATVTGLDPARGNVDVARTHAVEMGLSIDYREATIEELVAEGARFDIVLAMEVIEHVADVDGFVQACAAALKPGGLIVMATLNRTMKAYALAILGAEYVMRWVPKGTHQWEKFLKPDELAGMIGASGLDLIDRAGVIYRPFADEWALSDDMDVNYMMAARKAD